MDHISQLWFLGHLLKVFLFCCVLFFSSANTRAITQGLPDGLSSLRHVPNSTLVGSRHVLSTFLLFILLAMGLIKRPS